MPLHGIDHVELWVGNAAQAELLLPQRVRLHRGRLRAASRPGMRDRVSHVLQQGGIRLVLTGTLRAGHRDRRATTRCTATASR